MIEDYQIVQLEKPDDAAWEAAYAEGRTLTPEQAVAYALKETDA